MPLPYPSPPPLTRPARAKFNRNQTIKKALKTNTFSTFPLSSITEADLAAIISFDLLYEADFAAILPVFFLYEADFGVILPLISFYEAGFGIMLQ